MINRQPQCSIPTDPKALGLNLKQCQVNVTIPLKMEKDLLKSEPQNRNKQTNVVKTLNKNNTTQICTHKKHSNKNIIFTSNIQTTF